ncbi:unnamed protein product [Colias eurytheme]|nr:unnamed protein product [Colias eurytheme]
MNQSPPEKQIKITQQILQTGIFNRPRSHSLSEVNRANITATCDNQNQMRQNKEHTTWTSVQGKKRQRDSPINDRALKQTKLNAYWLSEPVPTSNSFAELDSLPSDLSQEKQPEKQPRPPPLFVDKVDNIRPLTKLLNEKVPGLFELKVIRNNVVKIQPHSSEAFKIVTKELDTKNTEYYTYKPKQERNFKVILKHMHPSTDTEDIREALAALDHTATNIWNIKQMGTKKALDMFVIELQPKTNNKEIYNIKGLLNCRIKFEPPRPKRSIPQCSNCQDYGHTKKYCRRKPRCIKCAGYHTSAECSRKERSEEVKCVLCNGNHPANYKGCSIYKELQKQKYPPLRNKTYVTNSITNLQRDHHKLPETESTNRTKTYAEVTNNNRTSKPTKHNKENDKDPTNSEHIYEPTVNSGDFKQIMNMFREMMQQMTTMTTLLMNLMSKLHLHSDP